MIKHVFKRVLVFVLMFGLIVSGLYINSVNAYAEDESIYSENPTAVLYVGGNGASDENIGTIDAPLATLAEAYARVPADNVKTYIVICGSVSVGTTQVVMLPSGYYYLKPHTGEVIITSKYGDVNISEGAGLNLSGNWGLMGDTTFEHITITSKADVIVANYYNLKLGDGITDRSGNELAGTVYLGTAPQINGQTVEGTTINITKSDIEFTMKSGRINYLYGGGNGSQGTTGEDYSITLNITGGTIYQNLYGSGVGAGCTEHKSITINIAGGWIRMNLYGMHGQAIVHEDLSINISGGKFGASNKGGVILGAAYHATSTGEVKGDILVNYTGGTNYFGQPLNTINALQVTNGASITVGGDTILCCKNQANGTMAAGSGFTALKLISSNVTVPVGYEAYWSTIEKVYATDDSKLTLEIMPTSPIDVVLEKMDADWQLEEVLIETPAGIAAGTFVLNTPRGYHLKYENAQASATWILEQDEKQPAEPGEEEPDPNATAVLYVGGDGASDENPGTMAAPLATLAAAYAAIPEDNVKTYIVICGSASVGTEQVVTLSSNYCYFKPHEGEVIITSKYGGNNYQEEGVSLQLPDLWALMGDTTFRNINIENGESRVVLANYFRLYLGSGIEGIFGNAVYLGTGTGKVQGQALEDGSKVDVAKGDIEFRIKSGTIHNLYGGGTDTQGGHPKDYSITLTVEGGNITTLYGSGRGTPTKAQHKNITINVSGGNIGTLYGSHGHATVFGDVSIYINGGVIGTLYGAGYDLSKTGEVKGSVNISLVGGMISSLNAIQSGAIVKETVLHYQNQTCLMAEIEGFTALKLINSVVTVPDESNQYWNTIKTVYITDNSQLLLEFVPVEEINVNLINEYEAGENLNTASPLIKAPANTGNVFKLKEAFYCQLEHDASDSVTTWTLNKCDLVIGERGNDAVMLDMDLGLPKGSFTPIHPNANAYEVFDQKWLDLQAVGAGTEVKVIEPVVIQGEVELHVSPHGDDNNNGSSEKPFRTIKKALGYVENLQQYGVKGVVIYLHGGTYLASDISMDASHSGTPDSPVIISAYNNEEVVITGGADILGTNFSRVTDETILERLPESARNQIMVVDLNAVGISELGSFASGRFGGPRFSVSVNGETLTLARYPDVTTIPLGEILDDSFTNPDSTGVEYVMTDSRPKLWQNDGYIWRYGNLGGEWYKLHNRVAEIRVQDNTIKLEGGDIRAAMLGSHYYYNVLEELNVPGEYYVDFNTGKLYLYPIGDMDNETVVTFTATMEHLIEMNKTENVVLNGLIVENGGAYGIYMNDCKNTLVQNCVIRHVENGINIRGKNSGIIYSEISEINSKPVNMGNGDIQTYDFSEPEHNFVQNCYVYSTGMVSASNTPIYVMGVQNVVSHNLIQGTNAISIQLAIANECIVEYNEIVGGPNGVYDYGSIYCSGANTGNHIRYNYIHDTARHSNIGAPHSIYCDEGSRGYFIYGNVMVNVQDGVYLHYGSDNVIVNNIVMSEREGRYATPIHCNEKVATYTIADRFAKSAGWQSYYETWLAMTNEDKAVFKQRYPSYSQLWEDVKNAIDDAGGSMDTGVGLFMAEGNYAKNNILVYFQGLKFDGRNHTVIDNAILQEDPFINAVNHNYVLKDGVSLGFEYQAINMDRVGIIDSQKDGINSFALYAPENNGTEKVDPYNVLLKWTLAGGADTYHITIATNEEMSQNVKELISEDTYCYFDADEYFDYDNTYYWTVVANATAKSRDVSPVNSPVFSFRTMTEEEYFEYNKPNFDELNQVIEKAEQLLSQMLEISEGGVYFNGSKAVLQIAIDAAVEITETETGLLQTEVNHAVVELKNSIAKAKASRQIQYVTFGNLDASKWRDRSNNSVTAVIEGQTLKLTNTSGSRKEVIYADGLDVRNILCFKYKIDEKKSWHGFAIAQTNTSAFITSGSDGYFICFNSAQIELQKYEGGTKVQQINVPNDGTLFTEGEYHDIEIGAINYEDGSVGIHFKVNGTFVFDPETYRDTVTDETIIGNPILGATGFGIVINNVNRTTYIMNTDIASIQ